MRMKEIRLDYKHGVLSRSSNVASIKAALESNHVLEELRIVWGIYLTQPDEVRLLFQAIASAPKLRVLSLVFDGPYMSPKELNDMFANALKECKNNTLEHVNILQCNTESHDDDIWNREVAPILDFNRERSMYQANASSCTDGKQLLQTLMIAKNTDNHHLWFWLVRNHAGDLRRGGSEKAQSRPDKRQKITK
jgi:hypothetical protein